MEEADCCLPVTKTTTESSDTCPTEDAIRALLENFVDPLLPSKPFTSDVPSKALRESVAKQFHLECLNVESFRGLAKVLLCCCI